MEHPKVTELRALLRECQGDWSHIQSISGLSYSWISQFARGLIPNPTINSMQSVSDACREVIKSRTRLLKLAANAERERA